MSIRILGLAVLKFFLLACGGCPFKGLFPMSVPRECEKGFLHLGASVQFSCSVVSDSLQPNGLQHARPPCPSPTPRVYSNSCPLSW